MTTSALADEDALKRFERTWQAQEPAPIEHFLPPEEDARYLPTLIELVRVDMEFSWKRRENPDAPDTQVDDADVKLVESYVTRLPRLNDPPVVLRLLELEYLFRHLYGDSPDCEEYQARFPDLVATGSEIEGLLNEFAGDMVVTGHKAEALIATVQREIGPMPNIPGYEMISIIAHGGMGVVYKARQIQLNRIVAIKTILGGASAGDEEVRRFHSEAEAVAQLHHPNIVAVHEMGRVDGRDYFSMDYVEGRSLSEIVRDNPLPAKRAARYVRKTAEAIQYAHDQGVLHRDLKPQNILIDKNNEPQITDFGLAKIIESDTRLTVTGAVIGTPRYMPPEQALGHREDIKAHSDVYSMGAILYQLITARPPFMAETPWDTIRLVLETEPLLPRLFDPTLPRDLETICLKCLAKDPARRYSTARELAHELRRFEAGEPILARPAGGLGRVWRWSRRNPLLAGLSAAALLLLFTVSVISTTAAVWSNAARDEAIENLQTANEQRVLAEEQRQRAEIDFQQTRKAVDYFAGTSDFLNRTEPLDATKQRLEAASAIWELLVRDNPSVMSYRQSLETNYFALGLVQQALGEWDAAARFYEKSLEIAQTLELDDPSDAVHSTNRALAADGLAQVWIVSGGDAERAIELSQFAVIAQPQVFSFHTTLGGALFRNGRLEEAAAELERGLELARISHLTENSPLLDVRADGARAMLFTAMAQFSLGQAEKARASLAQAGQWMDEIEAAHAASGDPVVYNFRNVIPALDRLHREADEMIRVPDE